MWGDSHWSGRPAYAQELVNGTTFALQQLTLLAAEGHSTPQVTVLVGLDNGGVAPIAALNEEIAWIRQNYLAQWPQHFTMLDGLPLLVVFDGSGERGAVQAEGFTLRWMASQMQAHCLPNVRRRLQNPHSEPWRRELQRLPLPPAVQRRRGAARLRLGAAGELGQHMPAALEPGWRAGAGAG